MKSNFWKVWGIPLIIGLFSAAGLLSALTGDGIWDAVSWITLGGPILVAAWYIPWRGKVAKEKYKA